MSWDCPYYNNDICQLNGISCIPGKGECVLKGKYRIQSGDTPKADNPKKKSNTQKKSK